MRVNDRVQDRLTSLVYYPERLSIDYDVAILKLRKAAHPFGLKHKATDFFTPSQSPITGVER